VSEPGQLLGRGRTADVYEHRDGVLRRYRAPRDTGREVAAMEHARSHGFPVPAARSLNDTDIVMERVHGPTMLDDLARRPWLVLRHAETLAGLHRRLHAIEAPSWLPAPVGHGRSLLHLDLHPDNVILGAAGPVVIDWPNAARGPGAADVAHTWLVLASASVPGGIHRRLVSAAGRGLFLRTFLGRFDRREVESALPFAAAHRLASRGLPREERETIERLARR